MSSIYVYTDKNKIIHLTSHYHASILTQAQRAKVKIEKQFQQIMYLSLRQDIF